MIDNWGLVCTGGCSLTLAVNVFPLTIGGVVLVGEETGRFSFES